jgi:hypothetical protein
MLSGSRLKSGNVGRPIEKRRPQRVSSPASLGRHEHKCPEQKRGGPEELTVTEPQQFVRSCRHSTRERSWSLNTAR